MVWETPDSDTSQNRSNNFVNMEETRGWHGSIDIYYEAPESGNDNSKSSSNELNNLIPKNEYKIIKNKPKQQRINVIFNESNNTLT